MQPVRERASARDEDERADVCAAAQDAIEQGMDSELQAGFDRGFDLGTELGAAWGELLALSGSEIAIVCATSNSQSDNQDCCHSCSTTALISTKTTTTSVALCCCGPTALRLAANGGHVDTVRELLAAAGAQDLLAHDAPAEANASVHTDQNSNSNTQ